MPATRTPKTAAGTPVQAPTSAGWESLDRRQVVELALPGALIGVLGAAIAVGLAASGGLSPGLSVLSVVGLGLPLAAVGAYYEILLAKGKVPLGPLAPMAVVWLVGFPLARIVHALLLAGFDQSDVVVPNGWADFVVYNILLSVPFSIGFWWLHENFAPRWWMHLEQKGNPVAARHMSLLVNSAERKRETRPDGTLTGLAGMQERRLARRRGQQGRHEKEKPAARRRGR
jgi:hypothetical protein